MNIPAPASARPEAGWCTGAALLLESAAAEYAMLAQRRSRPARQIELLDRQREAAGWASPSSAGAWPSSPRASPPAGRWRPPRRRPPRRAEDAAEAAPGHAPAAPAAPERRGGVTHEY
ncbi:hypothetical protein ACFFMP_17690 [Pseudoroseomonas cervicalis]|uniref:hypothetical protein n=1 Tax=Teichococcus cervicalis TaxID=204525 RepID=UPI0035ED1D4F